MPATTRQINLSVGRRLAISLNIGTIAFDAGWHGPQAGHRAMGRCSVLPCLHARRRLNRAPSACMYAAYAQVRKWQIVLQNSSSTLLHIRCAATDRILVLTSFL